MNIAMKLFQLKSNKIVVIFFSENLKIISVVFCIYFKKYIDIKFNFYMIFIIIIKIYFL